MNVLFLGTTAFSLRCLEELLVLPDCRIVGAISARKEFRISYSASGVRNVTHADVPGLCDRAGVPCIVVDDGLRSDSLFDQIREWNPDCLVVAGWFHMVPRQWRQLAPAYGLHASLLPAYRGGAPLVWAIINGEQRTGISLFQLGDGVDDGPIVGQADTEILPDDTIATLYARIEDLGIGLLRKHMPQLADGSAQLREQDHSLATNFPQRSPADGLIDWSGGTRSIYDFIRAQTRPYPGSFTWLEGAKVTIWSALPCDESVGEPGQLAIRDGRPLIGTGDGSLEVLEIAVDGKDADASGWWGRQLGISKVSRFNSGT